MVNISEGRGRGVGYDRQLEMVNISEGGEVAFSNKWIRLIILSVSNFVPEDTYILRKSSKLPVRIMMYNSKIVFSTVSVKTLWDLLYSQMSSSQFGRNLQNIIRRAG